MTQTHARVLPHSKLSLIRYAGIVGAGFLLLCLVIPVGLVALASGSGIIPLQFPMHLIDERLPLVFRVHMLASAAALLLIPCVIAVRRRRIVHRTLGRILGICVVAGALTALPVAIFSHSSLPARAGFFVQGLVWIGLLAAGIIAIRRRDRATHIRLMLAMAAVTSGAVWFRPVTGCAIIFGLPFVPIYAAAAWLCWLIPLGVVLYWTRTRRPTALTGFSRLSTHADQPAAA